MRTGWPEAGTPCIWQLPAHRQPVLHAEINNIFPAQHGGLGLDVTLLFFSFFYVPFPFLEPLALPSPGPASPLLLAFWSPEMPPSFLEATARWKNLFPWFSHIMEELCFCFVFWGRDLPWSGLVCDHVYKQLCLITNRFVLYLLWDCSHRKEVFFLKSQLSVYSCQSDDKAKRKDNGFQPI